jgi:hypothetical protein
MSAVEERPVAKRSHKAVVRRDDVLLLTVVAAVLALGCYWALSTIRGTITEALSGQTEQTRVVSVTVKPGDTLWRFARVYGAPGSYILDRVDVIARDNGLVAMSSLVPGQHLRIRVENPVLLARLDQNQRVASTPD